jgi:hypothetical protein
LRLGDQGGRQRRVTTLHAQAIEPLRIPHYASTRAGYVLTRTRSSKRKRSRTSEILGHASDEQLKKMSVRFVACFTIRKTRASLIADIFTR